MEGAELGQYVFLIMCEPFGCTVREIRMNRGQGFLGAFLSHLSISVFFSPRW